jgi:hypothetical protein
MKLEEIEKELFQLREQVDEMRARGLADQCLLEYGLFALPTANLRGMLIGMNKLGEELYVKLMNRPSSEAGFQAFAAKREYWRSRLQAEIASRE